MDPNSQTGSKISSVGVSKSTKAELKAIFQKYYQDAQFDEIDHGPSELCLIPFEIRETCLVISYEAIEKYYIPLMEAIASCQQNQLSNAYCNILLSMNGENDKAWNTKRAILINWKQQDMDLRKQLRFNGAICLKFKKSSSYYSYRLALMEQLLKEGEIVGCKLLQEEAVLMNSVLDRFKRNYYCWMYRLKLFQLVSNFGSKVTRSAIISTEIELIHKFIERNCNDYSAYSYLINLINRETVDTTNEIPWAEDMLDFCQRGYQQAKSFAHIVMYCSWLKSRAKGVTIVT